MPKSAVSRGARRNEGTLSRLDQNEIIVQAQVVRPRISGIMRLREESSYLSVDYDDETGLTNTVTAGLKCKTAELLLSGSGSPGVWGQMHRAAIEVQDITQMADVVI